MNQMLCVHGAACAQGIFPLTVLEELPLRGQGYLPRGVRDMIPLGGLHTRGGPMGLHTMGLHDQKFC